MNWFINCLKHYGLNEEEANKVNNSNDKIICVLKDIINDAYDVINDMNEDQKLFLFNRYDYKVTSTPMKLNSLNSNKLYKIHYKFVLK